MHRRNSAIPGSEEPGLAFAGFRLEPDGTLLRGDTAVHLPPKELAALRLLLAYAGRVVTPLQLRQVLWGDVHVTADSVLKCVSSLRARLEPEECIQTVYKRGYRFTAEVRSTGTVPAGTMPRLAILPFAAGHGVPGYLGAVLAEETMARLGSARPPIVKVLAQDSVFTLARRGLTALETGEALNADLVLAGSLRALPGHYRLRAEMIRVEDGTQIWVEDLLAERSRIAGLETELMIRLASRLGSCAPGNAPSLQSASASASSLERKTGAPGCSSRETVFASWGPDSLPAAGWAGEGLSILATAESGQESGIQRLQAYETFQRAHHEWQTLERHRMQDGLQHLLRATELDPSLIGARVDLVNLCVTQCFYGFMSPAVEADIVRRTAASGSPATGLGRWGGDSGSPATGPGRGGGESNPGFGFSSESMLPAQGWVQFHVDRNLPAALWAFSFSAHLPHDPWITRARSMFALSRHRFDEAIELLRAAILLDPYSSWLQARLAWTLHLAGNAGESVEQIRRVLVQFPEHEGSNLYGAIILAFNGEPERATGLAQDLAQRLPYFDLATAVHAYALACAGQCDQARAILERLQWLGRERFLLRCFTPAVYLALGEPDAALAELRAADASRCPWFFQMLADPRLKPLQGQPEFERMQAILAAMEAEAARDAELQV